MGTGKTYSTKYLLDSNNNSGVAGQVLSTTSTGIDWVDANTVPGAGLWLENGNDIYNSNSGNVGIGTTSPERLLSLYSNNTETTPRFLIEQDGTGDAVMAFSLTGGQGWSMGIDNSGADSFMIHDSSGGVDSSSQFTITTAGNVGIGTTSPIGKLQINGNGNSWNEAPSVRLWDTTNSKGWLVGNVNNYTAGDFYIRTFASVNANPTSASQEFTIKHATGKVGIGTTNPGYTLEIAGPSTTSFAYQRTGVSANKWGFHSDNNATYWQNLTSGNLLFTLQNGGNVGIGVTGPVNKIQANYAPVGIASLTASAGTSSTNWNRNAFLMGTGASVSNALAFGVSGTANDRKAWIQSGHPDSAANSLGTISLNPLGGNVGIGTTGPTTPLHVVGIAQVVTSGNAAFYEGNGVRVFGSQSYNFRNSPGNVRATINVEATGATAGNLTLYNASNVVTTKLNNAGDSYLNGGNVGIGTTSPDSKLELGPNGSLGANITNKNVILNIDGGYGTTGTPSSGQYKVIGFTGTTKDVTDITGQTSGEVLKNFYLGIIGSDYFNVNRFSFWQGGSERLTIQGYGANAGNVGIGTTNPGTKLHVGTGSGATVDPAYQIVAEGSAISGIQILSGATQSGRLVFGDSGNNDIGIIKYDHSNNSLQTIVNAAERMRIDSSGRVLIGTTTEGQANADDLTIANTTADCGLTIRTGNSFGSKIFFSDSTTGAGEYAGFVLYNHSDDSMQFGTSSSERMSIDSSGTVQVRNSASPTLQIYNTDTFVAVGQTLGKLDFYSTDGAKVSSYIEAEYSSAQGDSELIFGTSTGAGAATERMRIDSSGNVGIGTDSPSGPFHVKVGTSTPLIVASSSYCNNVGIRTTTPTASLQVKGNVSYSYNNYTNVANTWINVINFSGYPAGLYQISIIKKTDASTYITAIVKWSATAGTVISTIASNQLGITFSSTQLQAISGIATGTLMSANLQCLVTNEDFCS